MEKLVPTVVFITFNNNDILFSVFIIVIMLSHSGYNDCVITGHAERVRSAMAPIGVEYGGMSLRRCRSG